MFNVTVLSERNSKLNKKASPTLHVVELDFLISDYFGPDGPIPFALKAHENKLINDIVLGNNQTIIDYLS